MGVVVAEPPLAAAGAGLLLGTASTEVGPADAIRGN